MLSKKLGLLATCLLTSLTAEAMQFERACDNSSQKIVVGAVGDFLMHAPLQKNGNRNGYASLWQGVQKRISQVDLMYGNLETPVAPGVSKGQSSVNDPGAVFDNKVYSSYPIFNTPPDLIEAIKATGFDVVSTANNHAMDRGRIGVDRTVEQLEQLGLPFSGTRSAGSSSSFSTIVNKGGISVGFLSCTYSLNGFRDPSNQVLECYSEKETLFRELRELRRRVDAVIVTPHWGEEYQHSPQARERKLARELLEAGATAVLGTHPHVIQPIEKHRTSDGREGFIAYSTGNFIAGQGGAKRIGLMLFVGLSKSGGDTWVNGIRYAPTFMASTSAGVYFLDNTKAMGDYAGLVGKVVGEEDNFLRSGDRLVTNPECFRY